MASNKSKFAHEAAKIIDEFFGSTKKAMEWVEQNGLYEEARLYLLDMENAKNRTDFNKAKLAFKKNIVRPFYDNVIAPTDENVRQAFLKANPIMNFMSPKGLGSYDEIKKNEKVQNSKYAQINEDGSVSVPLLKMINDPGELSDLAQSLEVDAEDLRDHIINEWNLKKQREWAKEEAAMRKATIDGGKVNGVVFPGRKGVMKEFNKSIWSGVLKSIAPELYAGMRRDIAEGKGEAGSIPVWLGEHKKDVLLDAGRNAALAMTGYAANPIAAGTAITGTEIATLAGSDYYPLNLENATLAALTGYTAASIPSIVGKVVGAVGKYGGPFYKASRNTMRKLRRGEELPSQTEQKSIYDKIDHAYSVFYDIKNNPRTTGFDGNDVKSAVNEIFDMVKNSPNFPIPEGTLDTEAGREAIKKAIANLLNSKEGVMELKRGLTAPSRNRYLEWNYIVNNPGDNPETFFFAKQNLEKTKILFPEVVNEIKLVDEIGPGQLDKFVNWGTEKIGKAAYKYGSIAEPIATRALYDESLDTYAKKHPELIEKWKYEGIPQWDPFSQEFAEQYPDANGVNK